MLNRPKEQTYEERLESGRNAMEEHRENLRLQSIEYQAELEGERPAREARQIEDCAVLKVFSEVMGKKWILSNGDGDVAYDGTILPTNLKQGRAAVISDIKDIQRSTASR